MDVYVGGGEPHLDERLVAERAGAQHRDVGVEVLADPAYRRPADSDVAA